MLEILRQNMQMSPEIWHKIFNPFCASCLAERVRATMRGSDGLIRRREKHVAHLAKMGWKEAREIKHVFDGGHDLWMDRSSYAMAA